jgi:biotin carboxylase
VAQAAAFARRYPVHGVFGVDDHTALVAAMIAEVLGLPSSPVAAVRAAGDKFRQRVRLREAGVPVPDFSVHHVEQPVGEVLPAPRAQRPAYPVVMKPLDSSASRGVIRANDSDAFRAAHARLCAILQETEGTTHGAPARFLVESYVPGPEFALEGLVVDGRLHVLALFDKPDPLEGPFFAETIYVTPSRYPADVRDALLRCAQCAVTALGLTRGPVHAELRYNRRGAWVIELAARPIGGRCGQVLRFGPKSETTLEALHLAHALGLRDDVPQLVPGAHGVMMIPIPRAGVFREVRGVDRARAVPGVTDVAVTLPPGAHVRPLPEDARYLGFIFARGETPAEVEEVIRTAHRTLQIEIAAA